MFKNRAKYLVGKLWLLLVVLGFAIMLSVLSPVFLTTSNITNLFVQSTILTATSIGLTFVIIGGGIDLSVGSVMAASSIIGMDLIVNRQVPVPIGILIMLVIGILFGAFNGFFITKFNIPTLIVSLSSMGIGRGIVSIYANGANIAPVPVFFKQLNYTKVLGIPIIVILIVILAVIAGLILKYSVLGRFIYSTGGNELAAKLAGIRTKYIIFITYIISGFTASLAGLLLTVRLESAGVNAGHGIEMTAIAAVVIGGTSLFGGQGNIIGTILGVLIISLSSNAVNLLEVPPAWDQFINGVVILIAALLDAYRRKYENEMLETNIRPHTNI